MATLPPAELIKKKRNGYSLSEAELRYMVEGFVAGQVPEYQMAALLMSIYFKGMTTEETALLTEIMLHSGRTLDFSHLKGVPVDKHSSGGVGDKTSMILAPIAAAAGVNVPMIAGRGLGHTGGTLDKLEAIPGFRVGLSLEEFASQVQSLGVAIIGQTNEICPADKLIYALRDVTATVESLPLICASIMSKKLAEGIGALVLDIKCGSGAFMKTPAAAEALADGLMEIGTAHGKRVSAFLTNMEQPLGRFIGNSLEIGECISILKNESFLSRKSDEFADCRELSLELAASMIWLGGRAKSHEEGLRIANEVLQSGAAWKKFEEICTAQGGDLSSLPFPHEQTNVIAPAEGYVSALNTETIGVSSLILGAGRLKASDNIDPTAGIEVHKKLGDYVQKGDVLYTLFGSAEPAQKQQLENRFLESEALLLAATTISLQKPSVPALIFKRKTN
jgi:pyrimidine-nucleoside phosphorylase